MHSYNAAGSAYLSGTILVVEDDAGTCSLIADVLQEAGFTVATVDNGSDAVEWLRKNQPAMVLLDLVLPKVRGEQVLLVLSALYASAVPVITMTSQPFRVEAMRLRGACAHLSKPFRLDDMLSTVRAYL